MHDSNDDHCSSDPPQLSSATSHSTNVESEITALRIDMSTMKRELKTSMVELEKKVEKDTSALKVDITKDISALKVDMNNNMSALKVDMNKNMSALKSEMTNNMSELKINMTKNMGDLNTFFVQQSLPFVTQHSLFSLRYLYPLRTPSAHAGHLQHTPNTISTRRTPSAHAGHLHAEH